MPTSFFSTLPKEPETPLDEEVGGIDLKTILMIGEGIVILALLIVLWRSKSKS